jgi:nicotinamide phosphoribosyltransferase
VLNHVRVIQGDGVNPESIAEILEMLKGILQCRQHRFRHGRRSLQKVDRDTQKFAIKCSMIVANGAGRDVYKDPVTDPGKKSKAGYLDLRYNPETGYETVVGHHWDAVLCRAYENGEVDPNYAKNNTLADVRRRSERG